MYPPGSQIDVAMPDFRRANWKRGMSYFTLRPSSKKCNVAAVDKQRNGDILPTLTAAIFLNGDGEG
jgi:hypothetical protein